MIKWKDRTKGSYEGVVVSSEAGFGEFRLIVHRHIYFPVDMWLASCPGLFDTDELVSKDLNEAKCQATTKLQLILEQAIKDIIKRADGTDEPGQKHHGCNYFVLDLDHDEHALAALAAYAVSCVLDDPLLASDLMKIVNKATGPSKL